MLNVNVNVAYVNIKYAQKILYTAVYLIKKLVEIPTNISLSPITL